MITRFFLDEVFHNCIKITYFYTNTFLYKCVKNYAINNLINKTIVNWSLYHQPTEESLSQYNDPMKLITS